MDVLLGLDLGWRGTRLGLLVRSGILSTSGVEAQGEEVSLGRKRGVSLCVPDETET